MNGSLVSPLTVNAGGTLAGTGTVGNVTIASGGTYAPGNSIGTQTVAGNVTFAAGSTYAVEVNPAGQSDRIAATGTATLGGGTVAVLGQAGTYNNLTSYTILTAAGGVSGQFAGATSNLAFLTPLLSYGSNAVTLTLARNDVSFASVATTANQLAVARSIAARGVGNPVYNAFLLQTNASAPNALGQLSGEIYASLPSVLSDGGVRLRNAALAHGAMRADGVDLWVEGIQTFVQSGVRPSACISASRRGACRSLNSRARSAPCCSTGQGIRSP